MDKTQYFMCESYADATSIEHIVESVELLYRNLMIYKKANNFDVFEAVKVGRLLEGEALYYHDYERFTCVGFEVEYRAKDIYEHTIRHDVGFFPIWANNMSKDATLIFPESIRNLGGISEFNNGFNDRIKITEMIANTIIVHTAIKWFVEREMRKKERAPGRKNRYYIPRYNSGEAVD